MMENELPSKRSSSECYNQDYIAVWDSSQTAQHRVWRKTSKRKLARQGELSYNSAMAQWYRHPRFWLVLAFLVVLVVAAALWLRGAQSDSAQSPLPTPVASAESPLPTPPPENGAPPPPASWTNGGAVLLWVALGILMALVITFVILRWYRGAD